MTLPPWATFLIEHLVPREFVADVLDDLEDGFRRRRGGHDARLWLVGELSRTPYLGLWLQARKLRGGSAATALVVHLSREARRLARRPVFAVVSLLCVTTSVASITIAVGVLDGVLMGPLPYPEQHELVEVWGTNERWKTSDVEAFRKNWQALDLSPRTLEALRDPIAGVRSIGGFRRATSTFAWGAGSATEIEGDWVTPGFLETLGTRPVKGRLPTPSEIASGARVLLVDTEMWQTRFPDGGAEVPVTVRLDDEPYEVIGVMPDGFRLPGEWSSWWAPLPPRRALAIGDVPALRAVARVEGGHRRARIADRMADRIASLGRSDRRYASLGIRLTPLRWSALRPARVDIGLLVGAALLVVFVSTFNQTLLIVTRMGQRRMEVRTRAALGAPPGDLTLLSERVLIGVVGGAAGLLVAWATLDPLMDLLRSTVPGFPPVPGVEVNGRVVAASTAAVLVMIAVPALSARARTPVARGHRHRNEAANRPSGRRTQRMHLRLAAAGATILAMLGVLLARGVARLAATGPGFDADGVVYAQVTTSGAGPREPSHLPPSRLHRAVSSLPWVTSVAHGDLLPGFATWTMTSMRTPLGDPSVHVVAAVSSGYFRTLGIPVTKGRGFRSRDDTSAVVLSESLATLLFGDAESVGRRILVGRGSRIEGGAVRSDGEVPRRVVGVTSDVRLTPDQATKPVLYMLANDDPDGYVLVVRTNRASGGADLLRDALAAMDVPVSASEVGSLGERFDEWSDPFRVRMYLVLALAGLSALLTAAGVYGFVTYAVWTQRREIGVRLALGARAAREAPRVIGEALRPFLHGGGFGLAVAYLAGSTAAGTLPGLGTPTPSTCALAMGIAFLPALAAAWAASRRVHSVNPGSVLSGT